MIRQRINAILGMAGYRIVRKDPDIRHDLERGRYDWLRRRGIRTVLDIGANVGQFSSMIRTILPGPHIHAFEPLASCRTELLMRTPSLEPISIHPFALGETDTEGSMHRTSAAASSSLLRLAPRHREAFPGARPAGDEPVQVTKLDSIAPSLELSAPILLKADVQGYELRVLQGAEETLRLVDVLVLETSFVELYDGQPLFDDVYRYVFERGFTYHGSIERIVDPRNGEVLSEDSVFLRSQAEGPR